ncbi:MAG: hypothetical protein QOE23_1395, partial [Pseudonocardiales bacterium]|jgi:hypothetical protein|nr:hypothetical protein [Pseudonocardiales bacterium]
MPPDTLAAQAASALDALVHIRRDRDGRRRVEQVALWPAGPFPAGPPGLAWTRTAGLGPAAGQLRARLEAADVAVPALLAGVAPCQH